MDEEALSATQILNELTKAIRESRSATDKQLDDLGRQLQLVMPKIEQLQRDVLGIQSDMRNNFVSRAEYEPRHLMLINKMNDYDKIIADSRPFQERFFGMENSLKTHGDQIKDLRIDVEAMDERDRGALGRAVPWVSTGIAFAALVLTLIYYLVIK